MNKLTQNEIAEAEVEYLKWQKLYNETGDSDILWFRMEPYLRTTTESTLKKLAKNHQILYFEEKVDKVVDTLLARYVKDIKYGKDLPKTMIHWACVGVLFSEESKSLDAEKKYQAMLKEQMYDEMYREGEDFE